MENIITCAACGARNRVDPEARARPICGRCKVMLSPGGVPVVVTDASLPRMLAESRLPVLLDLWAPWCGPCRMLAPTLEQLAAEFAGKAVVAKMNVDENFESAGRYRVESIPMLILFKDGQVVRKMVGVQPRQTLQQALRAVV